MNQDPIQVVQVPYSQWVINQLIDEYPRASMVVMGILVVVFLGILLSGFFKKRY